MVFNSSWAEDIYKQKYSMGGKETWQETCHRVLNAVATSMSPDRKEKLLEHMVSRRFIPGGRYLYAAGRDFHQVNNCHDGSTDIITNKGVYQLQALVGQSIRVLNRFGVWEDATVKSFGVQPLQEILFSDGRTVLATENHRWWQEDGTRVTTKELKEVPIAPAVPGVAPDEEGIRHGIIFGDGQLDHKTQSYSYVVLIGQKEELHTYFSDTPVERKGRYDNVRVWPTKKRIKAGLKVTLQAGHYKDLPALTNCSPSYARGFIAGLIATDGSTKTTSVTISCEGYEKAQYIAKLAVLGGCRVKHVKVISTESPFTGEVRELAQITLENQSAPIIREDQKTPTKSRVPALQVVDIRCSGKTEETYCVVAPKSESFTLANGLITSNCFLFRAEDSREGWSDLMQKITASLMTGGGIGIDYSSIRPEGSPINRTGGTCTGPLALMHMVNESGRFIMQGGQRRSAIWAGLDWQHKDVHKFMACKDWSASIRSIKETNYNFPAPMELTNISVIYDTEFFLAVEDPTHPKHELAKEVWSTNCKKAFSTAEPGMSFNYLRDRESLRNACTEVTSEDDSDKCNLGTIWINHCSSREQFAEVVKLATEFLLLGGLYSDVPTKEIREVGNRNNRIGLGLGGIHEWLMQRDSGYMVTPELHKWLRIYEQESEATAYIESKRLAVNKPKGIRAIAPTGTIGILAETTTGIEPLFCKSYKRRYYRDGQWYYQYVVDGSVKSLLGRGIKLESIQDAYDISFKDRVKFQADVQNYVDMAISSTCNLPQWGSESNDENTLVRYSSTLLKYARRLRGFTCYPDGARGGQPLVPVSLSEALGSEGVVHMEGTLDSCEIGKGGVCGS